MYLNEVRFLFFRMSIDDVQYAHATNSDWTIDASGSLMILEDNEKWTECGTAMRAGAQWHGSSSLLSLLIT